MPFFVNYIYELLPCFAPLQRRSMWYSCKSYLWFAFGIQYHPYRRRGAVAYEYFKLQKANEQRVEL